MSAAPPTFSAVDVPPRARLSDAIADEIERQIVSGTLRPGDALPAERELARQLEVSRPSLREALLKLEARGILTVRRNAGYTVSDVTAPSLTDPLLRLMAGHPKAVRDVLELRQGLETLSAGLAALRATDADIAAMAHAAEETERMRQSGDATAAAEWDARFHLAIAEGAHNVALVHLTRGIFDVMRENVRRAREVLLQRADAQDILLRQHRALIDAIRRRDANSAVAAAEDHLRYIRDGVSTITG